MSEPIKHESSPLFRFYHGRSMRMTFHPGDCIHFNCVPAEQLKKGDIILFRTDSPPGKDVVHRIIRIGSDFLEARGDNNTPEQIERVPFHLVLGKAVSYEREDRRRKHIYGGVWGTLRAGIISKEGIPRRFAKLLWSTLRRSGAVRLFWKPTIETIHLPTDADSVVRLVCKGKNVGKWCTERKILVLKKPYDLVVRVRDGELQL